MSGGFNLDFDSSFAGGTTPSDFNLDFSGDFAGGIRSLDFNSDFNGDFAGGQRSLDFSFDFSSDFARVLPVVAEYFPSEYIAVPPAFMVQVPADYRMVVVQPEDVL